MFNLNTHLVRFINVDELYNIDHEKQLFVDSNFTFKKYGTSTWLTIDWKHERNKCYRGVMLISSRRIVDRRDSINSLLHESVSNIFIVFFEHVPMYKYYVLVVMYFIYNKYLV